MASKRGCKKVGRRAPSKRGGQVWQKEKEKIDNGLRTKINSTIYKKTRT